MKLWYVKRIWIFPMLLLCFTVAMLLLAGCEEESESGEKTEWNNGKQQMEVQKKEGNSHFPIYTHGFSTKDNLFQFAKEEVADVISAVVRISYTTKGTKKEQYVSKASYYFMEWKSDSAIKKMMSE